MHAACWEDNRMIWMKTLQSTWNMDGFNELEEDDDDDEKEKPGIKWKQWPSFLCSSAQTTRVLETFFLCSSHSHPSLEPNKTLFSCASSLYWMTTHIYVHFWQAVCLCAKKKISPKLQRSRSVNCQIYSNRFLYEWTKIWNFFHWEGSRWQRGVQWSSPYRTAYNVVCLSSFYSVFFLSVRYHSVQPHCSQLNPAIHWWKVGNERPNCIEFKEVIPLQTTQASTQPLHITNRIIVHGVCHQYAIIHVYRMTSHWSYFAESIFFCFKRIMHSKIYISHQWNCFWEIFAPVIWWHRMNESKNDKQ